MRISIAVIILLLITISCVEPYFPQVSDSDHTLVVEGLVENKVGNQFILLSHTSQLNSPEYLPESGATVKVSDNIGNVFFYDEVAPGKYKRYYASGDLQIYREYTLTVETKSGKKYSSKPEKMLPCPTLDSISYREKENISINPLDYSGGLQFYANITFSSFSASHVIFSISETWEFTVPLNIEFTYDTNGIQPAPGEYQILKRCWKSDEENNIYIGTSDGATSNIITSIPLHFVNTSTSRLQIMYSILVTQKSISPKAYFYFKELKKRIQESGTLYETQPARPLGNMTCVTHPEERVLGYFYSSTSASRRIFVPNNFGFKTSEFSGCTLYVPTNLGDLNASYFPYYLAIITSGENAGQYGIAQKSCFDCVIAGGTLTKPSFWYE